MLYFILRVFYNIYIEFETYCYVDGHIRWLFIVYKMHISLTGTINFVLFEVEVYAHKMTGNQDTITTVNASRVQTNCKPV